MFNYKEWYEKEKKNILAKRRAKYKNNKAYREKILKSNREGKRQEGFTVRQVADDAGLTPQDILSLEKYRVIPDIRKEGLAKRYYTDHQRNLIRWGVERFMIDPDSRWIKNRLNLVDLKEYFKKQNFKGEKI